MCCRWAELANPTEERHPERRSHDGSSPVPCHADGKLGKFGVGSKQVDGEPLEISVITWFVWPLLSSHHFPLAAGGVLLWDVREGDHPQPRGAAERPTTGREARDGCERCVRNDSQ